MELLTLLYDKGASLGAWDSMGDRELGTACRHGNVRAVRMLLDRGCPPNFTLRPEPYHDSSLCLATKAGCQPVVSLLRHGASVVSKDEVGWQPIRYAAYYGNPEILQLLLAHVPASAHNEATAGLSAENIGFVPDPSITIERRKEVQLILNQACTHSATVPGDLSFGNIAEHPDLSSTREVDEKGSRIPWVHHHGYLKKPINPYANTQTTVSMEDDRPIFAL